MVAKGKSFFQSITDLCPAVDKLSFEKQIGNSHPGPDDTDEKCSTYPNDTCEPGSRRDNDLKENKNKKKNYRPALGEPPG